MARNEAVRLARYSGSRHCTGFLDYRSGVREMRIIIADGTEVFVDDSDYAELANYVWHIKQRTNYLLYVYRYERCDIPNRISKYRRVKMHQQIMWVSRC